MKERSVSRGIRRFAWLAIALFAIVLVTEQLEHHDIACHLKNPQHCNACASSPLGSDPHTLITAQHIVLADAGGAVCAARPLAGTVLPSRSSGRSPPAV